MYIFVHKKYVHNLNVPTCILDSEHLKEADVAIVIERYFNIHFFSAETSISYMYIVHVNVFAFAQSIGID